MPRNGSFSKAVKAATNRIGGSASGKLANAAGGLSSGRANPVKCFRINVNRSNNRQRLYKGVAGYLY